MVGGTVANFVPAASGLRMVNLDPHLRDARTVVDQVMATIPGLSSTLPPKRDIWGDPLTVNKGLWVTDKNNIVDQEVQRMADEAGVSFGSAPAPTVQGVDLRDITMRDGRNAYDAYQEIAASPGKGVNTLKQVAARIIQTKGYRNAPDGEKTTRGTKAWMLAGPIAKFREAAGRRMLADPNVRAAVLKRHTDTLAAIAAKRAENASAGGPGGGEAMGPVLGAFIGGGGSQ